MWDVMTYHIRKEELVTPLLFSTAIKILATS